MIILPEILCRNSAPILRAPVPLRAWTPIALSDLMAGLSSPSNIPTEAEVKESRPRTGRYSWFNSSLSIFSARRVSAVLTQGSSQGLPSSVL